MSGQIKIGLIGLDTSHVTSFTQLLNNPEHEYHIPGGKVAAAYPGGSADLFISHSRVEGFTKDLQEGFDVQMVDSPEAVAEACDAIILSSVDGRVHPEQFRRIAPYGKPVFIDKPFAVSTAEAKAMIELAREHRIPMMSSSSLRYAESLIEALADTGRGTVIGADTYGPMNLEAAMPGYFWYGVHAVEMLFTILGTGCEQVTARQNELHDVAVGTWKDGRIGTVRGNRAGNHTFGGMVHRELGTNHVDVYSRSRPAYSIMLEYVMKLFVDGVVDVSPEETLQIIRFMEAANESRETGKTVYL